MKNSPVLATCLVFILLTACQSSSPPSPTVQPSDTPLATATSISTATPQPATPLPTPTPSPKPTSVDAVNITAFCTIIGKDSKTTVPQGTPIIITWGWEAKTTAQIDDFLQNNITTITLDGKALEGILTDAVTKNAKSGLPEVAWHADVGVLDGGEHKVTYDVKWKKMIDDGTTTYGPGGKNETVHDECQIIVK